MNRAELAVGHIPTDPDGLGPCSECPEHGPIHDGVALIGYHSTAAQVVVREAVCLAHLAKLTTDLGALGVEQVVVEIPSPCIDVDTPAVSRLHYERENTLIRRLVVEHDPDHVIWIQQRFTYTEQELRRIARYGENEAFAGIATFVPDEAW